MPQPELETRVALLEEGKTELQNSCNQWENEVDRLKFNAAELRRRLEDSQAALHELGRENQSLQVLNQSRMTIFILLSRKLMFFFRHFRWKMPNCKAASGRMIPK